MMLKQNFRQIGVFLLALFFSAGALAAQCTDVFQSGDGINEELPDDRKLTFDADDWPDPEPWPPTETELSGGDYYYEDDDIDNNYELTIAPGATVRIFVDGNLEIGNNSEINRFGDVDQLLLLVNGDVEIKNGTIFKGILYAEGDIELRNNSLIEGIVASEDEIDQANNADVIYRPEAATPALLAGLCEIAVGGGLPVFDNFESYTSGTSIDGNNGGSNWGGPWEGNAGQSITDTSDNPLEFIDSEGRRIRSATTLEITGNGGAVAVRPLDGTFSSDTVFLSMLVRFTGNPTNNDFVAFWVEESGFGASPQFGLKMNEGGGGVNDFFVRLDQNASYSTDLEVGETYLLVAQYSKQGGDFFRNGKLWVNPACEASPPATPSAERNVAPSNQLSEISRVGFRSANLSGPDAFEIGQVAMGTQWTDVVRCSPGPLVEYRMEQDSLSGAAGEILDTSGNNNHATALGGLQTSIGNPAISGDPGTCRYGDFDGSDHQIRDANAGDYLNGLEAVTVMAWVYNTAELAGNDRGIFFTDATGSGRDNRLGLRYDTQGFFGGGNDVIKASVLTDECNPNQECLQVETVSGQMVQDEWQHLAMTWTTDGEIKVYVNGTEAATSGTQGTGGTGALAGVTRLDIGQGSKNQRWQGGIDEFRIFGVALNEAEIMGEMNRAYPCSGIGPNHIRLNHPGQGLTCTPADNITITACANNDCSDIFEDEVTVELLPDSGWIPGRTVTFTGESDPLALRSNSAGIVTLGAQSVLPAPTGDPGIRCYPDGSATPGNCEVIFSESGFLLDVPDHISGQEVQASILAVKAGETDPGQCVPAFTEPKAVEFSTFYQNPATGTIAVQSGGTLLTGNSLNLDFDSTGAATFPLRYRDVGSVLLNARYEGTGEELGLVMEGQDAFIARPDRFEINVPGNPGLAGVSATNVFRVAGQSFDIGVSSLNTLGEVTPNFGQESPREGVDLGLVEAPSTPLPNLPPLNGSLGLFGESCASPEDGKACGQFSWPEVGTFSLEPSLLSGAYLGTENVVGAAVPYVGRFIPAWFDFSIDPGILSSGPLSASRTSCTAERDWVYAGEPFSWNMLAEITLTPRNQNGETVLNYAGTQFQVLEKGDIGFSPSPVEDSDATGADGSVLEMEASFGAASLSTGTGGSLIYAFSALDEFRYPKSRNARVAGYTPQPVFSLLSIEDGDGVKVADPAGDLPQNFTPSASFQIRYGRIVLENGFGPEDVDLLIPLKAEVFGGNGFELHQVENCWFYDLSENTTVTYDNSALTSAQTGVIEVMDTELTLVDGKPPVSPEDYRLRLSAPGQSEEADRQGIYVELDVGNDWLRDYWDADNPDTLVDPYAWGTFGVYRGNDRIIYWRER